MLCGGEAMPRALADRLLEKGAALWNVYGPTETTVWSSAWRVEPGDRPISIGRPIAETQVYVLDGRLRAAPVGVTGELYIGGAGVARGYLDRPGLTAERFVPDPFSREPGARLYHTGDLARWRPDGTLECLGRVDHQVKVRGFRVELGEIEAAMTAHPAVREAAVTARHDATGETSLAAYFVPRGEEPGTPTAVELRRWLQGRLPEYMVPSAFVVLDAMPMTPNGKVDRRALPDPARARLAEGGDFIPPRGPIEEALADAWSELLGVGSIGAHDNFFDRGGHSLMAIQLLGRIRNLFEVEAPLKDFIEEPTLANLARLVERAAGRTATGPWPPRSSGWTARGPCRPPSPSNASGSSTASSPAAPPTTSPPPSASTADSTSTPSAGRSRRSSDDTRPSAPPSPTMAASPVRSSPTRSSCLCPSRTSPTSPRIGGSHAPSSECSRRPLDPSTWRAGHSSAPP